MRTKGLCMERRIDQLLTVYSNSHQNPKNQMIHNFCVPAIMMSLMMLLWAIPFPLPLAPWVNWATLFCLATLFYYIRLSPALTVGMAIKAGIALMLCRVLADAGAMLWQVALAVFVVAWILQFIGHGIEGKKPSLVEDLQYLLVGPLWVLVKIYRRFSIPY